MGSHLELSFSLERCETRELFRTTKTTNQVPCEPERCRSVGPAPVPAWERTALRTAIWVVALALLASPVASITAVALSVSPHSHSPATSVAQADPVAPAGIPRPPIGATPGSEPFLNVGVLAAQAAIAHSNQYWLHRQALANVPAGSAAVGGATPNGATVPPLAPQPQAPSGTIVGVDNDCTTGGAISGATVTVYSIGGFSSGSGTTRANGSFTVTNAPAGPDYVTFHIDSYLDNKTYVTIRAGVVTNLGTICQFHDGTLCASILGDDVKHEKVPLVHVTATTRDGLFIATPSVYTNSSGGFCVPVPPVPSRIDFAPPPVYITNWTYATLAPYQILRLSTPIYLERGVVISAQLYDSYTLSAISALQSITGCSRVTNYCYTQGPSLTQGTLYAVAPPGPAYVKAEAVGYLVNFTPVRDIPKLGPGQSLSLGKVYLVPEGAFQTKTSMTWGNPTAGKWSLDAGHLVVVSGCSLDGLQVGVPVLNPATYTFNTTATRCDGACVPYGQVGDVFLPPLRDYVTFTPDISATCNGFFPTWPIPSDFPVALDSGSGNETWLNITPDHLLLCSSFESATCSSEHDLTAGTYIQGKVYLAGTKWAPAQFTVAVCSTDQASVCDPSVPATASFTFPFPSPPTGCASSNTTYCVPAPPGPVKIIVKAPGYADNYTWFTVPPGCCNKNEVPLVGPTVNLTPNGRVTGQAFAVDLSGVSNRLPLSGLPVVKACPAAALQGVLPCSTSPVTPSGNFSVAAPLGWDQVTVTSPLVGPNWTWVYVNGTNRTSPIYLWPDATVQGQVVSPNGTGLYQARVQFCDVDGNGCQPLGSLGGRTGSSGLYNGTVAPSRFPVSSYMIVATAAGYTSNWTWVNTSTGNVTTVPPIVLTPVGVSGPALSPRTLARAAASTASAGAWVDGRVVDNVTGVGITTASIQACPLDGGPCSTFTDGTDSGGIFNDSVAAAVYDLNFTAPNYYPVTVPLNATSLPVIHLGSFVMQPFAWETGRAVLLPWPGMSLNHTLSASVNRALGAFGLGASQANVHACDHAGALCGSAVAANTAGLFNVSAPWGVYDFATVSGSGGGVGSAAGGYLSNRTIFNATTYYPSFNGSAVIGLAIFGEVTGGVRDHTNHDKTPVRFATVAGQTIGRNNGGTAEDASGGGGFAFFLPPFNSRTFVVATSTAYIPQNNTTIPFYGAAQTVASGNLSLPHYGWAQVHLVDAVTERPIPYGAVSATALDLINRSTFTSSGVANGGGFLNLSAPPSFPPGANVSFLASGPDFNTTSFTAVINGSETTYLNATNGANRSGNLSMKPWAFVLSEEVSAGGITPPISTVVDNVHQFPLAGAEVAANSTDGRATTTTVLTNWLGQFFADAPPGAHDSLVVRLANYVANVTQPLALAPGAVDRIRSLNLTGYGIIAGFVTAIPTGRLVPGATVQACLSTELTCTRFTTTNGSGAFWIAASPGLVLITVTAAGYVSNSSTTVRLCSDCWVDVGDVTVSEFASVSGDVLGLPSGTPIDGANVTVLSQYGFPIGISIATSGLGSFLLPLPAGTYILEFNATGYNVTLLPIALKPGESVFLGVIYIEQLGVVDGTVYSADTLLPIGNATVVGCAAWGGGPCSAPTKTDPTGRFTLQGPSGPYRITISADGYTGTTEGVTLGVGTTIVLAGVYLYPVGTNLLIAVSGHVYQGFPPGAPIPAATVAFEVGGVVSVATTTNSSGGFTANVLFGTYTIVASANGYRPVAQTVAVHQPNPSLALVFDLPLMTYSVSGRAVDGLTGAVIADLAILTSTGKRLASVDSLGTFSFSLANGTYPLSAAPGPSLQGIYAAANFEVTVNGGPVLENLSLVPPILSTYGETVNAVTGLPVGGVTVTIVGTALDGAPISIMRVSNQYGTFSTSLPSGTYHVLASASGYAVSSSSIAQTSGTVSAYNVVVALTPMPSATGAAAPSSSLGAAVAFVLAALAVAAGLGIFFGVVRRRPHGPRSQARPPPPSRAPPRT